MAANVILREAALTTCVIREQDELFQYGSELDRLFADTNAPITCRWDVIEVWLRHHPEAEPLAVMVWDKGNLVAAALLSIWKRRGAVSLRKIGEFGEPFSLPSRDESYAAVLADGLANALGSLRQPWSLHLSDLPVTEPVAELLSARLTTGRIVEGAVSPQLWFQSRSNLNAYLSRNTRSALAKAINRVARDQLELDIQWITEYAEIARNLPEVVELHRDRNRQRHGYAILDDAKAAAFFGETVLTHARRGRVRLLTVRLDGMLAAFMLGLLDRGTLWVYANLVSPNWLRYSAGTIANADTVRACCSDPSILAVNWGAGIERYKMSGNVTLAQSVDLYAWSSRGMRITCRLRELLAGACTNGLVKAFRRAR